MVKKVLLFFCLFVACPLFSDEVRISDGTVLVGTIQLVTEAQIEIKTGFAGVLKVDRNLVFGFTTDKPVFVRLESGAVISGTVSAANEGVLEISGEGQTVQAALTSVRQSWEESGRDPEVLARQKAAVELEHKWKFRAAVDLSGRSGNSSEKGVGLRGGATLVRTKDELELFGSYCQRESNGEKSSDERKVGAKYTSYLNDPWGWYVRQEFEEDLFENLKVRSISAGGLSYRKMKESVKTLGVNVGLNYRHEVYLDNTPDRSNVGLDFGLEHFFGVDQRFAMRNSFTLVPSIADTSSFLATQDSHLDVPLNDVKSWKVRFGLRNDYNSQPTGGRKSLDSRYYSSFVAEWN